jgi:hypothetical protein
MRTCAVVLIGVVACATAASAQTPSLSVLAPAATDMSLGPRTLNAALVACTDLPTTAPSASPLRIIAAQTGDKHLVHAPGDIVVLNGGTPLGLVPGHRYFVRRLQFGLTGEPPSATMQGAVRTAGWLVVIGADERFALAKVEYACDTIITGDYLEPFVEPVLPTTIVKDGRSNFTDMGQVLFGADRRQTFGSGDIANIDRGKAHGIGVGTRVAFYRDRVNGTPLVEMGAGVVVEVAAETSKVVLVRASEVIIRGDYVAVRGTAAAPQN